MYLRSIKRTDSAALAGSSASSQPRGLPVSTEQNRQARVHTSPISMMVAVPALQHSPMFGHFDSEHTVANLCFFTFALTCSYLPPEGSRTRSQSGLRRWPPSSASRLALMPSRIAVNPCGFRTFSPLFTVIGMVVASACSVMRYRLNSNQDNCNGIPVKSPRGAFTKAGRVSGLKRRFQFVPGAGRGCDAPVDGQHCQQVVMRRSGIDSQSRSDQSIECLFRRVQ